MIDHWQASDSEWTRFGWHLQSSHGVGLPAGTHWAPEKVSSLLSLYGLE